MANKKSIDYLIIPNTYGRTTTGAIANDRKAENITYKKEILKELSVGQNAESISTIDRLLNFLITHKDFDPFFEYSGRINYENLTKEIRKNPLTKGKTIINQPLIYNVLAPLRECMSAFAMTSEYYYSALGDKNYRDIDDCKVLMKEVDKFLALKVDLDFKCSELVNKTKLEKIWKDLAIEKGEEFNLTFKIANFIKEIKYQTQLMLKANDKSIEPETNY